MKKILIIGAFLCFTHAIRAQELLELYKTIDLKKEFGKDFLQGLDLSSDGKYIGVSANGLNKIWQLDEMKLITHTKYINSRRFQFSPTNKHFGVVAFDETKLQVQEYGTSMKETYESGALKITNIKTTRDDVNFKYSKDGKNIFIADEDGIVMVDALKGKKIATLGDKKTYYYAIAVHPSSEYIACSRNDGTIVYRVKDNKKVSIIPEHCKFALFSNDGKTIYFMNWSGAVSSWDPETGTKLSDITSGSDPVDVDIPPLALTPNGKYLFITTSINRPYPNPVYDTELKTFIDTPIGKTQGFIYDLAISGDGRFFACKRYNPKGSKIEIWKFTRPQK